MAFIDTEKITIPKGFFDDLNVPKLLAWLNTQPTADVVEVVRCEKCIHGEVSILAKSKDGKETWGCYCNAKKVVTDVDAYCSCGKKRGNENDNKQ